ncbi:hypothetical protein [Alkalimarinus alittae]|uniref:PIN domain-containing protein n=1 Tax=Alkalimarinus alittae TaxID=2961619 RepID=A0ABY6N6L9_9ALTE|nr:hypothetical protein [Alkalimarinus alittae]UZE97627.1 hypothetical protein NKI27_07800 [Alkalimarinus alittae]
MSEICLIDTSIFLNLLNVPGRNQDKEDVVSDFKDYAEMEVTFILPMATILETGNHIAQNGDGGTRRTTAERFCLAVEGAFNGQAPYQPSEFPNSSEVLTWLSQFPDHAGQNKSSAKTTEGTSFGDLSIIKEYEKCLNKFGMSEIFIWSLDSDLSQFHHKP